MPIQLKKPLVTILFLSCSIALSSCTAHDIKALADAKDPKSALRDMANAHVQDYANNPEQILSDFKKAQNQQKIIECF